MSEKHPADILKEYAASLPTTISGVILASCAIAFGRLEERSGQDFLGTFNSILDEVDGHDRCYRCALVCGAMELALQRSERVDDEELFTSLAEKHDSELFKTMALQAPLRKRHWQDAAERFESLRQGDLSARNLRRWLEKWMVENPPRIPGFYRNPSPGES